MGFPSRVHRGDGNGAKPTEGLPMSPFIMTALLAGSLLIITMGTALAIDHWSYKAELHVLKIRLVREIVLPLMLLAIVMAVAHGVAG